MTAFHLIYLRHMYSELPTVWLYFIGWWPNIQKRPFFFKNKALYLIRWTISLSRWGAPHHTRYKKSKCIWFWTCTLNSEHIFFYLFLHDLALNSKQLNVLQNSQKHFFVYVMCTIKHVLKIYKFIYYVTIYLIHYSIFKTLINQMYDFIIS